jgi:SAM-dependent methyltransferase
MSTPSTCKPLCFSRPAKVAAAGLSERVHLHHQGASSLPLADGSVDLAIVVSTLGELPDKLAALSELHRVLARWPARITEEAEPRLRAACHGPPARRRKAAFNCSTATRLR